jgi:hypothetical protein
LLGLLDTGATGIFVKREAFKGIVHQVEQVNFKVKGRFSHPQLKEIAIFDMILPDFCGSHHVTIRAYIEENSIGRYDIVLGIRFIKQLGLIFDFLKCIVTWNTLSIPMRQHGSITPEELSIICDQDAEAPEIIHQAVKRIERAITSNEYDSHNYQSMVLKCVHLTTNSY